MAHLLRQLYGDEIDFETVTIEKKVNLVFAEMIHEPSAMHRDYFETLFDMSCYIWFQLYSKSKRNECISNFIDYIICVCKLKFTLTV